MIALLIGYESLDRLINPVPIAFDQAIPIAVVGLGLNLLSAYLLRDDHDHRGHGRDHYHGNDHEHEDHDHGHRRTHIHLDHNLRAAFVHVMAMLAFLCTAREQPPLYGA
jgi:Co/Zn/Cd efflux system component